MAKRTRTTMNISLPAAQKRYIEKLVESGDYQSASEVVRVLLRESEARRTQLASLHRKIEEGRQSLRRGEYLTLDQIMSAWDRREALATKKMRQAKSA